MMLSVNLRNDFAHVGGGTTLGAHLHHLLIFIDRLKQQLAFVRVLRPARVFDINVFAWRP